MLGEWAAGTPYDRCHGWELPGQDRKGVAAEMLSPDEVAATVRAAGTPDYVPRLIDLVAGLAPHDLVTVTRYSPAARPVFVTHRNFSAVLVEQYLAVYHTFDPFNAYWRRLQQPGIVPLRRFAPGATGADRYVGEFLRRSAIRDEIGVLLSDGEGIGLGVFLERGGGAFEAQDIARLERVFPAIAAVHEAHLRLTEVQAGACVVPDAGVIASVWPELTPRERGVVALMLAGHPTSAIATRLRVSRGTVRNYRSSIYDKLDITSEREVFLQWLASRQPSRQMPRARGAR